MSVRQTSTFDLYPAIDLRGGRVVRLRQGDFEREQVYDDDPVAVVERFAADGARWVHVVDLDGARAGERRQAAVVGLVAAAARAAGLRCQVAGGLRTSATVDEMLAAGSDRIVIGTAALTAGGIVEQAIAEHDADRIAVALDVRDGLAVGDGWVPGASGAPFEDVLERLTAVGVAAFIVTAIERDGLLGGPDLGLLEQAIARTDAAVIASGGVASIADLHALRRIGCRGAIVGRALYDGRIDLAAALAAVNG